MENKNKATIWLVIFIILFLIVVSGGVYAYYIAKEIYTGSFNVEVTTKGVDTFKMSSTDDITIKADSYNFIRDVGHSVSGSSEISVSLNTTKQKVKYCYDTYIKLPDEVVFEYSNYPEPELLLSLYKSLDGENYLPVIENMDITKKTERVSFGSESIETTKNVENSKYYKATITLQYFPKISQEINEYLNYTATLTIDNVVEC